MKKTLVISLLGILTVFAPSAYVMKDSNGKAGYTGAPGELTCSGGGSCHNGGSSATKGVTLSAIPSFTADQYMADSTYVINIQVAAAGFNWYGFGCEILDSLFANAGTMQLPGSGVKLLNSGAGRRNATHTTPKNGTGGTSFSFQWTAPSSGRVNFYFCCNSVNHNGSTTGDLPIPGFAALYPAPLPPVDTTVNTVGLNNSAINALTRFHVFPNPVSEFVNVSYSLKQDAEVTIDLLSIEGVKVCEVYSANQGPGTYSQIVKIPDLSAAVYFLRINMNGEKVSQKLITVR